MIIPDVLPPVPDAGGYEGMRRLAETCRELGYLFSLHDQYRDYYVDVPSYNVQFAIHEEDQDGPPPWPFPPPDSVTGRRSGFPSWIIGMAEK